MVPDLSQGVDARSVRNPRIALILLFKLMTPHDNCI
jgi:hypothetical protein